MQVKEIDIDTGKIKGYGICKKKYEISFLGGPTTPTYSIYFFYFFSHLVMISLKYCATKTFEYKKINLNNFVKLPVLQDL